MGFPSPLKKQTLIYFLRVWCMTKGEDVFEVLAFNRELAWASAGRKDQMLVPKGLGFVSSNSLRPGINLRNSLKGYGLEEENVIFGEEQRWETPTVPIIKFVLYLILSSFTLRHSNLDGSLNSALLIFVLSIGAYDSELMIVMFPLYLFWTNRKGYKFFLPIIGRHLSSPPVNSRQHAQLLRPHRQSQHLSQALHFHPSISSADETCFPSRSVWRSL
jgi:hypothetical protein